MNRFDIDDIHDELRAGRDITASQALVYAQHHIAIAIADEREACAKLVEDEGPCRHVDHVQGFCACQEKADMIRARSKL